ncbi:hypothetical protein ABL78_1180 [Leptomonas seymouri]|uniref:Uncharacterized protein n=1 Tax=Leptomonas seymouri TaxID=5684 RepID=A0A0N0P8L8_LEPSE|nr:hypothetical protein ABL78_1180 [Leptomonas seymouri]|eukprot:KPI89687.1 hypothetical protein ABL78_1180 [Leptomonas seymouri]
MSRASPLAAQSTAFPPQVSVPHDTAALDDVARRLLHLLHSPPLSLAALATVIPLFGQDVQRHHPPVAAASAQSPNQAMPALGPSQPPAAAMRAASQGLPPLSLRANTDTIGSPVTAPASSVYSPTSAPSPSASAVRVTHIHADVLAQRLVNLYAHYPSYVLREWLHSEAMRLGCPTYQDPVSNDITATAETLRQREELVKSYIRLYAEVSPTLAAADAQENLELTAWSCNLHALMGCHHQRERHCPHRSLDGFKRQPASHAAPLHAVTEAASKAGASAQAKKSTRTVAAESPPPPRRRRRPNKETSVALQFVERLLRSTLKLRREQRQGQRSGHTEVTEGAAHGGRSLSAASASEQEALRGATADLARPPDAPRVGSHLNLSEAPAYTAAVHAPVSHADANPWAKANTVHPHTANAQASEQVSHNDGGYAPRRRPPPAPTSLDCMAGLQDITAAPTSGPTNMDDVRPTVHAFAATTPARHGPRIALRPAPSHDPTRANDSLAFYAAKDRREGGSSGNLSDSARLSPVLRHRARRCRHRADSTSSVCSSSSVSLPVMGEEGEDELSLSESVVSADSDEEVDSVEGDRSAQSIDRPWRDDDQKQRQGAGRQMQGICGGGQQGQPYAATTTTMDFLASRNGGLLSTASASPMLNRSRHTTQQRWGTVEVTVDGDDAVLEQCAEVPQRSSQPSAIHPDALTGQGNSLNPLLAGYTRTRPFTLAELSPAEAQELLRLPFYAQAHELNRLAGLRSRTCYQDPYTSCLRLTSYFLDELSHCYGEQCMHCPHGEVCERRQLRPPHRRHHHHHPWRAVKTALPPHASELSSSSSSFSSFGDDEDADDPEAIRFFQLLDAADAAANGNTVTTATAVVQQPLSAPTAGACGVASPPSVAVLQAAPSTSASSSSCSSSSLWEGSGEQDEQHRHHLLRSAALYSFDEGFAGNTAGVVVEVNSLRDLLSWGDDGAMLKGHSNNSDGGMAAAVSTDGQAALGVDDDGEGIDSLTHATDTALPDAQERRGNPAGPALLISDGGAAVDAVDDEERRRRHEALFERYSYLDYSAL